jgi:uncharacterized OsmC-like protein
MGLLLEIDRRGIHKKKGFGSIFEFAFKLAGLSEEQVRRVLNLEKRFETLPALQNLLLNGEVSVNKLARVASIANAQNEQELAEAVKTLPKTALETLVRDEKSLSEPKIGEKSVPGHTSLQLSDQVASRLQTLQDKGLDINGILTELLDRRDQEIEIEKQELSKEPAKSRHVPIKIQRLIQKEHGSKCSISTCLKPAQNLHHTQFFSLGHSHDPHFLAPLCKDHHTLAHSINLKMNKRRNEFLQPNQKQP